MTFDPTPPWFQGGGAVPYVPSLKDFSPFQLPGISEWVAAGAADPVDWSPDIKAIEDQQQEGACVGFSQDTDNSFLNFRLDRGWDRGDGRKLWQEMGGVGQNGVDSRATLERVRSEGSPLRAGGRLKGISAYAFVPRVPGVWRQTIAAGQSLGKGGVAALLLPPDLGWNSGTGRTQLYHQMKIVGFTGLGDGDYCLFVNSWGPNFGRGGFCRVPWIQMEADNFQQGYAYAFRIINLTNAHRVHRGLKPLAPLPALSASALAKSQDMGQRRYFEHVAPDGQTPIVLMERHGLRNWTHWGENIAGGQTEPGVRRENFRNISAIRDGTVLESDWYVNPGGAFTDWLNSPGHRANIEFPGFTHLGVGHAVVPGSPYVNYYTQHFAALGGDVTPPPPPPPVKERIILKAEAVGVGKEGLAPNQTITAQGHGFIGTISISEVTKHKTDDTTPPPPPPPPPPPVGDLTVEVQKSLRRLWTLVFSAKDRAGNPVSASFMVKVNGILLPVRSNVAYNVPRLSAVVATATATDGRTGQIALQLE
jgi:uncharacterized protein YkwD